MGRRTVFSPAARVMLRAIMKRGHNPFLPSGNTDDLCNYMPDWYAKVLWCDSSKDGRPLDKGFRLWRKLLDSLTRRGYIQQFTEESGCVTGNYIPTPLADKAEEEGLLNDPQEG